MNAYVKPRQAFGGWPARGGAVDDRHRMADDVSDGAGVPARSIRPPRACSSLSLPATAGQMIEFRLASVRRRLAVGPRRAWHLVRGGRDLGVRKPGQRLLGPASVLGLLLIFEGSLSIISWPRPGGSTAPGGSAWVAGILECCSASGPPGGICSPTCAAWRCSAVGFCALIPWHLRNRHRLECRSRRHGSGSRHQP